MKVVTNIVSRRAGGLGAQFVVN